MASTLRQWLNEAEFDWEHGRIIFQEIADDWPRDVTCTREIAHDHPILDLEFSAGYGAVACPSFIAEDPTRIYFAGCYDGSSWIESINKDINHYLDPKHIAPCIGGG